jgi:site-specific DNA-adenine methylase
MNYGIPYMGSKSKIVDKVCRIFPKAENFYDLFGGGFSVSHYMIRNRSKDYKEFHFNEIRAGINELIKDALAGKYSYENFKPEWISRERFNSEKDSNAYIKIIWSFGNNGDSYLFGESIEQYKKPLHNAVVFNEFDDTAKKILGMDKFKEVFSVTDRRLFVRSRIALMNKGSRKGELQQLERLQQLQQLHFYNTSYEKVPLKKDSIVYCDIPYIGTADYGNSFNHRKFYDWASSLGLPVFVSEYRLDDSRFKVVASFEKKSLLSATENRTAKAEKVFANKEAYELLRSRRINAQT